MEYLGNKNSIFRMSSEFELNEEERTERLAGNLSVQLGSRKICKWAMLQKLI
jgi:hypothetical protein